MPGLYKKYTTTQSVISMMMLENLDLMVACCGMALVLAWYGRNLKDKGHYDMEGQLGQLKSI